jgi:hypothetical protein
VLAKQLREVQPWDQVSNNAQAKGCLALHHVAVVGKGIKIWKTLLNKCLGKQLKFEYKATFSVGFAGGHEP